MPRLKLEISESAFLAEKKPQTSCEWDSKRGIAHTVLAQDRTGKSTPRTGPATKPRYFYHHSLVAEVSTWGAGLTVRGQNCKRQRGTHWWSCSRTTATAIK